MRPTHTSATPTGNRFNHDGVSKPLGGRECGLLVFNESIRPRRHWHTGFSRESAANGLVFQGSHRSRSGADEPDIAAFAYFGEVGILRQKTVSGVDCVDVSDFGGPY